MEEVEGWSAGELMEWTAFERVWGPILPHERIDIGLASVQLVLARIFAGKQRRWDLRDFLPSWTRELTAEAQTRETWMRLLAMANEEN